MPPQSASGALHDKCVSHGMSTVWLLRMVFILAVDAAKKAFFFFFNGYGVLTFARWKVLEIGCTTMWIYLTLLKCTLTNGKDGKYYVIHFYNNKKEQRGKKESF